MIVPNTMPKFLAAGDKALTVEFGNTISEEINNMVITLSIAIEQSQIRGVEEVVPTYRSLLIYYDPLRIDLITLKRKVEYLIKTSANIAKTQSKTYIIPVLYGKEFGPDLSFVAKINNISESDVIEIHSLSIYKIYMIGFAPGFPYLGGMSEKIAAPRLETPRKLVKAGSVGIAGNQTGIYPIDDPGGWRIIGRTPIKVYNPYNTPPVLFSAGDYIKFKPITEKEYYNIVDQINKNLYNLETITLPK